MFGAKTELGKLRSTLGKAHKELEKRTKRLSVLERVRDEKTDIAQAAQTDRTYKEMLAARFDATEAQKEVDAQMQLVSDIERQIDVLIGLV